MRNYVLDFLDAAEEAAVSAAGLVAKGDKNHLDKVAVDALRKSIGELPVSLTIVTGEGVIDKAPLLSAGEVLGLGGIELDMAVDPVDGTTLAANGQPNSLVSLAIGPKGSLLPVPDMYMEKMICSVPYILDLERPIEHNIRDLANALHKGVDTLKVAILNKPRHEKIIQELRRLNVQVYLINDGDILATLDVMRQKFDLLYSVGGAPEGIISAAICKALCGDMVAKLVPSHLFKEVSQDYLEYEQQACKEMNLTVGEILPLSKLVSSSQVFTVLTALTDCSEMKAPEINCCSVRVQSVVVEGEFSCITTTNKLKMNRT
ncbi:class II fructose-bisphosphatase [Vibrio sp.]|nr:class II fructose-bisphosphatase [Vibrio sp.]